MPDITLHLTDDETWQLMDHCRRKLGIYPLSSLCREDVLGQWLDIYEDIPGLQDFVDDACERTARHWEDEGIQYAWDRAIELVEEYAILAGIEVKTKALEG